MNASTPTPPPPGTQIVTLVLPVGLAHRARTLAIAEKRSLSKVVADLLDQAMAQDLPTLLSTYEDCESDEGGAA